MPWKSKICAKILKDATPTMLRRIGGPRHWCGKLSGHRGECGEWQYGSQIEHVEAMRAAAHAPAEGEG